MRRTLISLAALVGIIAATACSDMTGPKSPDFCPISGGSQTCDH